MESLLNYNTFSKSQNKLSPAMWNRDGSQRWM
jgi:hypothetical protein